MKKQFQDLENGLCFYSNGDIFAKLDDFAYHLTNSDYKDELIVGFTRKELIEPINDLSLKIENKGFKKWDEIDKNSFVIFDDCGSLSLVRKTGEEYFLQNDQERRHLLLDTESNQVHFTHNLPSSKKFKEVVIEDYEYTTGRKNSNIEIQLLPSEVQTTKIDNLESTQLFEYRNSLIVKLNPQNLPFITATNNYSNLAIKITGLDCYFESIVNIAKGAKVDTVSRLHLKLENKGKIANLEDIEDYEYAFDPDNKALYRKIGFESLCQANLSSVVLEINSGKQNYPKISRNLPQTDNLYKVEIEGTLIERGLEDTNVDFHFDQDLTIKKIEPKTKVKIKEYKGFSTNLIGYIVDKNNDFINSEYLFSDDEQLLVVTKNNHDRLDINIGDIVVLDPYKKEFEILS